MSGRVASSNGGHRVSARKHIRRRHLAIAVVAVVAAASLGGSCFFETGTTLCDKTGLRCRPGQVCAVAQGVCVNVGGCGDGEVSAEEVCDDGNIIAGDGCSADCNSDETCGNGVTNTVKGESCDDGNGDNSDACPDGVSGTCRPAVCGDGHRRTQGANPEGCDNGSANSNMMPSACRTDCRVPFCGDGVIDAGEVCDPGGSYGNLEVGCPGEPDCLNCTACS